MKFYAPPQESMTKGYITVINKPVNLNLVKTIYKSIYKWNASYEDIPSIIFNFGGGFFEEWLFDDETKRDNLFIELTNGE